MSKNNKVDTAQKGQTANKIQPEKVQNNLKKIQEIKNAKKDKTPTGKVILISEKESKRKAREEQYRNFRINALKRRADRMGLSKEEVEEAVKKLIEQMDAPKEYNILIMVAKPDIAMLKEALAKEDIKYAFCGDDFVSVNGNQDTLAKIREIAPTSAKIYPHAKKMESVLPKKKEYSGYIAKNNDKSSTAKGRRLARKAAKLTGKLADARAHDDHKLHAELQKQRRMNNKRKVKKALKKLHIKLSGTKKKRSSIVVQMPTKKASKGSKTLKKAA
jgi:hypothetical protein